ncbi:HAD family hydrolase [Streptomyces sp. SID5643]|uniref:HAD family hydrolase n=1 Tax=Streptomyces sp. SID5643 TaxID=2690307 RepID=UPI00136BFFE0|nr:HAD family hydrolase [Streptomyces sp. SID5643]MZF90019.1 HAD-IA family hydrolase [Streptomyces sp. SID5643]
MGRLGQDQATRPGADERGGRCGRGADPDDAAAATAAARDLLARAGGVLFDFDGPICRLFPGDSSLPVADELRELVTRCGCANLLTGRLRTDKDPHLVLRAVRRAAGPRPTADPHLRGLLGKLEERVAAGEVAAARVAWPTPDADALIRSLAGRRLRLAVVTNNSPRAADAYLREHGLRGHFHTVHGRTPDPDLMKPHPDVVHRALTSLRLRPQDAVMIGDTSADVEAAGRAGVPFIGYGRNELKRARLREAGATVVLGAYASLLDVAGERGAHDAAVHFAGEAARR